MLEVGIKLLLIRVWFDLVVGRSIWFCFDHPARKVCHDPPLMDDLGTERVVNVSPAIGC